MNFCSNCGAEISEGTAFCPNCGAGQVRQYDAQEHSAEPEVVVAQPVYQQPVYQEPVQQSTVETTATLTGAAKILSIISMVCGLVSLVSCYAGFAPGIAALILSNMAFKKAPGVPNSKAKTGKITGIIGIIVSALCLIGYIVYWVVWGITMNIGSSYYY